MEEMQEPAVKLGAALPREELGPEELDFGQYLLATPCRTVSYEITNLGE
eukprot:COSAG02_NODE_22417_length_753_cov_1.143731_1_plen_48_part_10